MSKIFNVLKPVKKVTFFNRFIFCFVNINYPLKNSVCLLYTVGLNKLSLKNEINIKIVKLLFLKTNFCWFIKIIINENIIKLLIKFDLSPVINIVIGINSNKS